MVLLNEHWSLVLSDDLLPGVMGNKSEGGVPGCLVACCALLPGVMVQLVWLRLGAPARLCPAPGLCSLRSQCRGRKRRRRQSWLLAWPLPGALAPLLWKSDPGPGPGCAEDAGSQGIPWVTAPAPVAPRGVWARGQLGELSCRTFVPHRGPGQGLCLLRCK